MILGRPRPIGPVGVSRLDLVYGVVVTFDVALHGVEPTVLSQVLLILVAWTPFPLPVPPQPVEQSLPVGHAVVLWVDGDVTSQEPELTPPPLEPVAPVAVLIGDTLAAPSTIRVPRPGALTLLVGGDRLVRVRPGLYALRPDSLREINGPRPKVTPLGPYREGNLTFVPPPTSFEPTPEAPGGDLLRITAPQPTVIRDQQPLITWRYPPSGGRFDLTVRRVDVEGADEGGELIEQWRGLAGRSHRLVANLRRGARYQVVVAQAGARPIARAATHTIEFQVLAAVERRALDGALDSLATVSQSLGGARREVEVLRARLFESYGLLADAERVWSGLAILEPGRAELRNQARRLYDLIHAP